MPATAISQLVIPQVWDAAIAEAIPYQSSLIANGIVVVDTAPRFVDGDTMVRLPFLKPLSGSAEVVTENTNLTVNNFTSDVQMAPIARRANAWGVEDSALIAYGEDLLQVYVPQISDFFGKEVDRALVSTIKGAFTTALGTSHVYDHDASTAVTKTLTAAAINEGKLKLGEASMVGMDTLVVHSKQFADLSLQGLSYVASATFGDRLLIEGSIPVFMGLRVVINDALCAPVAGKYSAFLMGGQPLYVGYQRNLNIETDRQILLAAGTNILKGRVDFCPHVIGMKYTGPINPTNANLEVGASYAKVFENANIKIVKIVTQ